MLPSSPKSEYFEEHGELFLFPKYFGEHGNCSTKFPETCQPGDKINDVFVCSSNVDFRRLSRSGMG